MNSKLESTVLERTLELQRLNEVLEIENVERQAAEASLQQINAELESRVFERTSELQDMNASLEEEVTERQAAEEALLESETRLESILSAMPDIILLFDKDTRLIDIRRRQDAPLFIPMPLDKALKKSVPELLPPQIAEMYEKSIWQVLQRGSTPVIEFSVPIDGRMRSSETRFVSCGSEEVLAIIRDVTERKHDEAVAVLFREMTSKVISEEPIDAILTSACEQLVNEYDFSYCGLRWKDHDGTVGYGAAAGKLAGIVAQEEDYVPRWDKTKVTWLAADVILSGKSQVIRNQNFITDDTRKRFIKHNIQSAAVFPILIKGETVGVFQIFSESPDEFNRETTVLRLENFAEQIAIAVAMSQDRQRLKLLTTGFDNTSNSIIITSPKGVIQWVNPAFGKLYGYSAVEAQGKNAAKLLVSFQTETPSIKKIRTAIIKKQEWFGEIVTLRSDGSEVVIEGTLTPILDELGEIVNFLVVTHDITDRIKAQQAILDATEARSRAERLYSIGTMAAGISHEINQPLNSIKIISSGSLLLLEQGKEISSAEFSESLTEISRQADAISSIINHLRSVIRQDASTIIPCDLNASVKNSLDLVGKQIASHGIIVKLKLQENLPPILAVSTALEEIVINLLVNAMQALDTVKKMDKHITIRTCFNNGIRLEISDNGPGINQTLVKKIFEPFFSTKSGGNNLGLGLAIVNSIVTSYHGTIEAISDGISGSTIRIIFPVADQQVGGNP
jgi:PAS domain S-box-containing protein